MNSDDTKTVQLNNTVLEELFESKEHPLKKQTKHSMYMEATFRFRRWSNIQTNGSLQNPPPPDRHFRLVFAITADVSESEVSTTLFFSLDTCSP